jgi:valyl-tRNA synthetase
VTETIWQTLDWTGETLLIAQSWPTHAKYDDKKADQFEEIKTIVGEIRLIKSSLQLRQATLYFTDTEFLRENAELITGLAGIDGVKQVESGEGLHLTQTTYSCWLDVDKETMTRYESKLQKQLQEAENKLDGLQKRLSNEAYVKQAPKKLIDETRGQAEEAQAVIKNIQKEINRFGS